MYKLEDFSFSFLMLKTIFLNIVETYTDENYNCNINKVSNYFKVINQHIVSWGKDWVYFNSDNVDYANKTQSWSGYATNMLFGTFRYGLYTTSGIIQVSNRNGAEMINTGNSDFWNDSRKLIISLSYGNSNQETRPKTKFFSLLIYAGYPMQ